MAKEVSTPITWTEVEEDKLLGTEVVQETTDKIVQIKKRLKVSQNRQKSYADNRRKPLEFSVGDKVLLKVSTRKGVTKSRSTTNYSFIEEPIEILDRGVKKLKRGWIPIVKVRWNSRQGPEFTWEREDEMKRKSQHLVHTVGNKMHKAFPLPGESSHWQYKFPLPVKVVPTARRLEMPLPKFCTVIEVMMKKLPVKDR
nr:hypothetical protein [Tanacetum cinerariifolium]